MSELFAELATIEAQASEADAITASLCYKVIINAFRGVGIQAIPYSGAQTEDLFLGKTLRTNVPFRNIYGDESKSELVYYDGDLSVRIKCLIQNASGSVDEKFPFVLENAKAMPGSAAWLILAGDGARRSAVRWLRTNANSWTEKVVRVYSESEAVSLIDGLVRYRIVDAIPRPISRSHLTQ